MGIRLENVCYTYGSDTTSEIKALNNVNLEINKGEFVAIIGHTGSGKSTLIQHFNGLERPKSGNVFYNDEKVARIFKKHGFYRYLKEVGVDWTKIISKKLLPDDSIYVIINNTLFIIECKYQQVAGSVDEKLQTCDFKRKQYQKLMAQLNIDVEYIYLLSDWFKDPKYKDVLDYIISVRCHYYFEYIPLTKLGLPVPPNAEGE